MKRKTLIILFLFSATFSSGQWVKLSTNTTVRFYTLFFTNPTIGFAGGAQETIIKTIDGGNTWTTVNQGSVFLKYITSIYFIDSNNGFALGGDAQSGGIGFVLRTTNGGNSWSTVNNNFAALPWKSYFIDANTGYATVNYFISSGGGLYKTTNGGVSWANINPQDNAFDVHFTSATEGYFTADANVYKTTNSGSSWTNIASGIRTLHFTNASIGYGLGNDISKTLNSGQTWTLQSTIDSCSSGNGEVYFYDSSNGIIVPQYGRIYFTHDGGNTWAMDNQLNLSYFFAAFMTGPNVAFAAGESGQIWRNNSLIGGIEYQVESPVIKILPNPFSSQTTFQTDKFFKNTTLTVYNSYGQAVKQIDRLSGQTITFHRDNLPSGLYFIRLTQDSKTFPVDKLVIVD